MFPKAVLFVLGLSQVTYILVVMVASLLLLRDTEAGVRDRQALSYMECSW